MSQENSGAQKTIFQKQRHRVTLLPGDGVGPEVIQAACRIVEATGVQIDWEECVAGKRAFESGIVSGVAPDALESLSRTRVALKGPLETPIGFGGKSANVTLRKMFETFGNIRPVKELPGIRTPYSGRGIDLVVIRENVEDLYAGIEHGQTSDVAQCLKLISSKGCEKIARLAFEFARSEGRTKVDVATKANIMKKTEGLMKKTFERVAKDYPDIQSGHILIDNCAHQLVVRPEQFDIILTTNMNGDIISDLTSGLVGGLGLAPSANIGHDVAIFEAVHGSAPDIAGMDRANPTAIILSTVMMLRYLQESEAADQIEAALLKTLEDGHGYTLDVARGRPVVGTRAFTANVIANLGKFPRGWQPKTHHPLRVPEASASIKVTPAQIIEVVGVDVFIEFDGSADVLGAHLEAATHHTAFKLKMISNRGTQVYPDNGNCTDCVDHWRCRFMIQPAQSDITSAQVGGLLHQIEEKGLRWMHIEKLNRYDGEDAFTRAQGEN